MRVKLLVLVLIAAVALVSCPQAWALGGEIDTGAQVVTKLFRGIVNAATGWIEIPKQISITWQANGPGVGMTWGLIKGLGFAVARSVAGGYEIATFPMPIPEGYRPIMHPEYVLSDLPGRPQPSP